MLLKLIPWHVYTISLRAVIFRAFRRLYATQPQLFNLDMPGCATFFYRHNYFSQTISSRVFFIIRKGEAGLKENWECVRWPRWRCQGRSYLDATRLSIRCFENQQAHFSAPCIWGFHFVVMSIVVYSVPYGTLRL